MTFTYILRAERKGKKIEYSLRDARGNVYMESSTPKEINGNPTTTFLADYAKLHERVLNERVEVKSIETKFELDDKK